MDDWNPLSLAGRHVLVTGASAGIGQATARMAARLGARVIGIGRNEQRLQETLDSLCGQGHIVRSFDLTDTDAIPAFVEDLVAQTAPLSGLVHCAGAELTKPLSMTKTRDFESLYRINVVAAGMLLRAMGQPALASPQGCSCVMIGSVTSLVGAAGLSAYSSTKAALIGLVKSAALEFSRNNIRVNAVLPGMVMTELTRRHLERLGKQRAQQVEQMHPLGLGEPGDVAAAIVFLLADTAKWITGSCLVVDGGYTAH